MGLKLSNCTKISRHVGWISGRGTQRPSVGIYFSLDYLYEIHTIAFKKQLLQQERREVLLYYTNIYNYNMIISLQKIKQTAKHTPNLKIYQVILHR